VALRSLRTGLGQRDHQHVAVRAGQHVAGRAARQKVADAAVRALADDNQIDAARTLVPDQHLYGVARGDEPVRSNAPAGP
jgi:hypothetical protein